MIGVGWVVLMDDWLSRGGPAGGMLGFLIGGLLLFPIAHTYGRLVQRIRDAGAEIAYTEGVFPPFVSYRGRMDDGPVVRDRVSVGSGRDRQSAGARLPGAQQLSAVRGRRQPDLRAATRRRPRRSPRSSSFVNYRGIKPSGIFQDVMTFGLLATFAIFTRARLRARHRPRTWQPLFSHPGTAGVWLSIFLVLQIVPYFMTGFESVAKGSEEAQRGIRSAQLHEGDLCGARRRLPLLRDHHRRRHLRLSVAGDRRRATCAPRSRSSGRSARTRSRS